MHKILTLSAAVAAALILFNATANAASAVPPEQRLRSCLAKADELPDAAKADADNWIKQGGGDAAVLCRATAEFHTGDFFKSAQEFSSIADKQTDPRRASLLYRQAGLAYSRVENYNKSEEAYGKALKYESQDPDLWCDRARARASAQHYWEAIDDLNKALSIMPDMPEALRIRGQTWFKLGMGKNAEADFRKVAEIQAEDDVAHSRFHSGTVKKTP